MARRHPWPTRSLRIRSTRLFSSSMSSKVCTTVSQIHWCSIYFTDTLSCGGHEGANKNTLKIPMVISLQSHSLPSSISLLTHMRTLTRSVLVLFYWFAMCRLYLVFVKVYFVYMLLYIWVLTKNGEIHRLIWPMNQSLLGFGKVRLQFMCVCMCCRMFARWSRIGQDVSLC